MKKYSTHKSVTKQFLKTKLGGKIPQLVRYLIDKVRGLEQWLWSVLDFLHNYIYLGEIVKRMPEIRDGKALIITGPQMTDKRVVVRILRKMYGNPNYYLHVSPVQDFNPIYYTPETSFIPIQDVFKDFDYAKFSNYITEGLTVKRDDAKPFTIHPKFVFTSESMPVLNDKIKHLFDVYEILDHIEDNIEFCKFEYKYSWKLEDSYQFLYTLKERRDKERKKVA